MNAFVKNFIAIPSVTILTANVVTRVFCAGAVGPHPLAGLGFLDWMFVVMTIGMMAMLTMTTAIEASQKVRAFVASCDPDDPIIQPKAKRQPRRRRRARSGKTCSNKVKGR